MAGKGKVGIKAKREINKKAQRPTMTRGGIRRLARRGGVKRISDGIYHDTRNFVEEFLKSIIKDASVFADNSRRKTITAMDVVYSLKRNGKVLYGFGG